MHVFFKLIFLLRIKNFYSVENPLSAAMSEINDAMVWQARLEEAQHVAMVQMDARMKADVLLAAQQEEINRLRSALLGPSRTGRHVSLSKSGKEVLRRDVEAFVRTRVTEREGSFVSTNELLSAFLRDGFVISAENTCLFYRVLKACLLKEFPSAAERRTWRTRGYSGIVVEEDV